MSRDRRETHLIDIAQADGQGRLLGGVLLLAQASFTFRHAKAKQNTRKEKGEWAPGEN